MTRWLVPAAGPGVCRVCHGPAGGSWVQCWCCRTVGEVLADEPPPTAVAASLYRPGDVMHRRLRRYKDAPSVAERRHHVEALARILDRFLVGHEACLRRRWRAWDTLALVPSTRAGAGAGARRRGLHVPEPFEAVVDATHTLTGVPRLRLVAGSGSVGHLRPAPDAFCVEGGADAAGAGRRVLVLDDTWTTGAHARSAAVAVTRAGAEVAGVLVIGRIVDPGASAAVAAWWARSAADGDREIDPCCFEGRGR